jgi:HD superfamily phosphohydrolase
VIDHELFQRLRYIKQLGLAEYVFPCANHTRFQHSLGASYLAGEYYENLVASWLSSPFLFDGKKNGTQFYGTKTFECIKRVTGSRTSSDYWKKVACLAALLHDIGHGPWSHTFETLPLQQDFLKSTQKIKGIVGDYYQALHQKKEKLSHEDISIDYVHQLFHDLEAKKIIPSAELYFLPVATLINKNLSKDDRKKSVESEIVSLLKKNNLEGGIEFHRLLRPIISGPFDVDRIDYIQRDGRNCGVHIAGVEWRRIMNKVVPCLAEHKHMGTSKNPEPEEVILISNIKNQHIIDDFIFTLFQMYAQVYLHPKIVGLEEVIRRMLRDREKPNQKLVIDFDSHKTLSDEKFRELLKGQFGLSEIDNLLGRQPGFEFDIGRFPDDPVIQSKLKKEGYRYIEGLERPLMKDSVGVFLYSSIKEGDYTVEPWSSISPIANQFYSLIYHPHIWIRDLTQSTMT